MYTGSQGGDCHNQRWACANERFCRRARRGARSRCMVSLARCKGGDHELMRCQRESAVGPGGAGMRAGRPFCSRGLPRDPCLSPGFAAARQCVMVFVPLGQEVTRRDELRSGSARFGKPCAWPGPRRPTAPAGWHSPGHFIFGALQPKKRCLELSGA